VNNLNTLNHKGKNKNLKYSLLFFIFFYIICCFLSFNRHSKAEVFDYHSEIFSDKSGYYIYLPALFVYNFQADKLPPKIELKTGNGFSIDSLHNKIVTKYSYGVALMQSPFFIVTHLLAKKLGYPNTGFSLIYNKMLDIAGVFYVDLAFIFLYFFLIRYVPKKIALISLGCIFLGTNLFYYSIFETGMSHIYSFFLFSVFLFFTGFMFPKLAPGEKPRHNTALNIIFGFTIGLIIMVRPVNVIFLPVFFLFNQPCFGDVKNILKSILIIAFSATIIIIPQVIYWKYLSGHFFMYSYPNEGFTNFFPPKIGYWWLSTNNGLIPYTPLVLLILAGLFMMRKLCTRLSLVLLIYFIFISYIFSSWWCWNYGCSFGCRSFVEFYALFSLPFCYFIKYMLENKIRVYILTSLLIFCVVWNLKLTFSYDGCWYGGDWDWQGFGKFLVSPTK
jgi:hypothetical protein